MKSFSNFSSSISCVDGSDLITSQCPSRFLNTRNALAALSIQFSSTVTTISYTPRPFFNASLTAFISKSAKTSSDVVPCAASSAGWLAEASFFSSTSLPPMNELSALRTSENTFSISCVRFCILLYPIVPAIPFKECAALNISLIVSLFSGSFSRINN